MQIQLLTSKKDIIIMSLVCFPFKVENPQNLIRNIKMAAGHPRVSVVLCVGVEEEDTF
jgi:mannosylglycerate synthase